MDDLDTQDHHEELSKDDLEVLQAFHDLEFSTIVDSFPLELTRGTSPTDQPEDFLSEDDMLALFATEADEDITTIRMVIQRIERANMLDSQGMKTLKRRAHKIAGTAAAIGCASMSTIARHVETIIKLVEGGNLSLQITLIALTHSVQALEATLQRLVADPYLRAQMGARAVAVAREHSDAKRNTSALLGLLKNIVDKAHSQEA